MSLSAGTRLGPYEVLGLIGAGGMGEVYKARDTRLDRTVAIKVLPPDVSGDPERRARFEREAKTVAALNHAHICVLHDVGDHEGQMFLVMEHLAGQTLAERLERGRLPLEQALTVATELAEALSAAHRQGVIHRDLKPANVMLTKSGAKLLDFGLAKLTGRGEQPAASYRGGIRTHPGRYANRSRRDRRHPAVHGPRAVGGQAAGRAHGPLGAGRHPLRDGDGQAGVRGDECGEPHRQHHERRARGSDDAPATGPGGVGPAGDRVPAEGPSRAPPGRTRRGVRSGVARDNSCCCGSTTSRVAPGPRPDVRSGRCTGGGLAGRILRAAGNGA